MYYRDNKVIIPSGLDTEPKDSVIIVTTNKYIYNLEDIFNNELSIVFQTRKILS